MFILQTDQMPLWSCNLENNDIMLFFFDFPAGQGDQGVPLLQIGKNPLNKQTNSGDSSRDYSDL